LIEGTRRVANTRYFTHARCSKCLRLFAAHVYTENFRELCVACGGMNHAHPMYRHKPALWRRIVRRVTDWVHGEA